MVLHAGRGASHADSVCVLCKCKLREEGVGECPVFSDNQCLINEYKCVSCGYVDRLCNETADMLAKLGRSKRVGKMKDLHCQCLGHLIICNL